MIRTHSAPALAIALVLASSSALSAVSQSTSPKSVPPTEAALAKLAQEMATSKSCPDCAARRRDPDAQSMRTFYLKFATSQAGMNEIATTLRTMLSQEDKIFVVPTQSAIVVRAIPEDIALAQKYLDDLDRPTKTFRLTYTVSEMDGSNRLGTQHYSLIVASGQQTILKQVNKVPIATGSYGRPGDQSTQTQLQYQDVGMSFDTTLEALLDGSARLRSDVVQSGLAEEKSSMGQQDPVFRHSEIRGEAILVPNKPLILGSMDIPGSTHRLQIEVLMEPLP